MDGQDVCFSRSRRPFWGGVFRQNDFLNEDLLYRLFGVNAELLIDHAWGWEPCTMADIKAYKPESSSVGSGQVLQWPYPFEKARLAVHEMADLLSLDLVDKGLAADQIVLTVGYDMENLKNGNSSYSGETTIDRYGRKIPKHAHGTANLDRYTSSSRLIIQAALELFDRIVNPDLLVRRLYLTANHVLAEKDVPENSSGQQLSLFSYAENQAQQEAREAVLLREKKMQEAVLEIKRKFGKNAILKGMNLVEGATAKDRNGRIGGHKA